MIRYFDSSALAKRYVREEASSTVTRLLGAGLLATSRLSVVEVVSAVHRRARAGDIARADAEAALARIAEDRGELLLVEFTVEVEAGARAVLARRPLCAGDAVQLASALDLRVRSGEDVEFVAYDARLVAAAEAEGLTARGT